MSMGGGGGGGAADEEYTEAQAQLARVMMDVGDELMDEYRWGLQPYQEASTAAAYSLLGPSLGLARMRLASDARNMGWSNVLTDASAITDLRDVDFYNNSVRPYQQGVLDFSSRVLDENAHIMDIMRPNWDLTAQNIGIGLQGMRDEVKKLDPEAAAAKAVADVASEFDKSAAITGDRLASFGLSPASPRFQFLQNQNAMDRARTAAGMGSQARDREREKLWGRFNRMAELTPPSLMSPLAGQQMFGVKPSVRLPAPPTIGGLAPTGVTPDQFLAAYKAAASGYDSAGGMSRATQPDKSGENAMAMMGMMTSMAGAAIAAG